MIETLFSNEWLSLKAVRDPDQLVYNYVFSHESRCQGRIVVVLPYRYDQETEIEFLVRSEVTPCWSMKPILSAVTGGYEGGNIAEDAVRELQEETGFTCTVKDLTDLGTCYASKSSDTVYSMFAVNLTGKIAGELTGDPLEGPIANFTAGCKWISMDQVPDIMDAQFSTAVLRFKYYKM
jgi:8-oxo-dGTP pyrophosphatase MutT (NUDIX family)